MKLYMMIMSWFLFAVPMYIATLGAWCRDNLWFLVVLVIGFIAGWIA